MLKQKIHDIIDNLVVSEELQTKYKTLLISLLLATLGLIMTIVNLIADKPLMMAITGTMLVTGVMMAAYVLMTNHYHLPMIINLIVYMSGMMCFLIFGLMEGFTPYWICLMPFLAFFLYGLKRGLILATMMAVILILFLWTPLSSLLQYDYSLPFIVRFPFMYLAFLLASLATEVVRSKTTKKLQDSIKKLEALSRIDELTGLENRRAFQNRIEETWHIFHHQDNYISLLMVDIDDFKKYNDHYGHVQGDVILKEISKVLQSVADQANGYVSRWGGEEFIFLLPFTNGDELQAVGQALLNAVRNQQMPHDQASNPSHIVTVSLGRATVHKSKEVSLTQAIEAADSSLYMAKDNGKDQLGPHHALG